MRLTPLLCLTLITLLSAGCASTLKTTDDDSSGFSLQSKQMAVSDIGDRMTPALVSRLQRRGYEVIELQGIDPSELISTSRARGYMYCAINTHKEDASLKKLTTTIKFYRVDTGEALWSGTAESEYTSDVRLFKESRYSASIKTIVDAFAKKFPPG